MTPQLQQAIKLLQFTNLEVAAFIDQELERNPLLVREDDAIDSAEPAEIIEAERPDAAEAPLLDDTGAGGEPELDLDYDNRFSGTGAGEDGGNAAAMGRYEGAGRGTGEDGAWSDLEQTLSERSDARAFLRDQMLMVLSDTADRMIGHYMIDSLDDTGYLAVPDAELGAALGTDTARIAAVRKRLQACEPVGVFARDLRECLVLQLAEKNRLDPAMAALLDNLELLARHDIVELKKRCGVDDEDFGEMCAELRALNPKPLLSLVVDPVQPMIPDVLMRARPDGGWALELNAETLPRVLVDNSYRAAIESRTLKREDRSYLTENLRSANWLVKALHQRATTILKVSSEIVRQQDGFFRHGISHLKPIILKDVAEAIDMHESTVSRVTSGKYIATPRGIFELKYFFTQAIGGTAEGASHSAEAVRHRIKALIDTEPPRGILSDDKIVDILRAEGIDIARRTVAKYRESLGIGSSVQRRRQKAYSRAS